MKIIITGALGHIGSKLIRDLPKYFSGVELILIDNLLTQRYFTLFNLPSCVKYKLIAQDLLKLDLDKILKDANLVIHLAAITDATTSMNCKDKIWLNNFEGTKKVAQSCVEYNVPLIFLSSTSVYGSSNCKVDEFCKENQLRPQSPYAKSKLEEERFIQNLANNCGLSAVILRLGTIYGVSPGMRFHTAVNKFCWQAVLGEKLTVWSTAFQQKRPYLYLEDCIQSIRYFIQNKIFDNSIYNVVSGNHTVEEVISHIAKLIPHINISFVNNEIMNQLSYEVINTRLSQTDFKVQGNLAQGINETISLLRNINYENVS